MAIDKLRYFASVVETKSLRKAADLVGITPGSMSKSIMTLEIELGVKLLRPEGRGIEITDQGMQVYRKSAHLLDEYRSFKDTIKNQMTENLKKIRIGTFEVFSTYFLSAFLTQELSQHQALLLEFTPGNIESAICDNVVDFALTYLPAPNPNLEFIEVGQFKMGIWGQAIWIKKSFEEWPFAVPTTSVQIHSIDFVSLDMWPQNNFNRTVKYQFELLETALQTSRLGHSVLHCPDLIIKLQNMMVKKEFQLEQLPYPERFKPLKPVKIYLVAKKGNPLVTLIEGKLAKFLRSLK